MSKTEQQKEHFEKVTRKYYEARQSDNYLCYKDLLWKYFFKNKSFLKKEGMYILEPMCGYAEGKRVLEKYVVKDFQYEGFDYSEVFVEIVKKDLNINIMHMDINLFKPSRKYDLIILLSGLHHVPNNLDNILKILYDSLKEGGYFINFEATHNNFIFKNIRAQIYKRNFLFDSETERDFDLNELNGMYLSNNFKIIDQVYPGLLSYVLYCNPDAFPFLNIGNVKMVEFIFNVDKYFFRNFIGKIFSFASLTLLQKVSN